MQTKPQYDTTNAPHNGARLRAFDPADGCGPEDSGDDLDIALIVGRNLRKLRTRRGYSLERLAKLSGVSRAMLGQIELGRSVPTINLLWKIARALEVPLSALTAGPQTHGTVVLPVAQSKVLVSQDGAFSLRALFPFDAERRVEFYELKLAPGGVEKADPHSPGTLENAVVSHGKIEIEIEGKGYLLDAGDAIFFEADVAHTYRNPGGSDALMYLVRIYTNSCIS